MYFERRPGYKLLIIVLVFYAVFVGGTFNGLVSVEISQVSLGFLSAGMVTWLVWRLVRRVGGLRTPLDHVILAGAVAAAMPLITNGDAWRRMAIGAWYWALIIMVWWVVWDVTQQGLPHRWLIDALLVAAVPVVGLGYIQVAGWLQKWMTLRLATDLPLPFAPPRPTSLIGNPNALGSVLIVLILLAAGRAVQARRAVWRLGWGAYVLLGGGLLFLTLSRGAWVGLGTAGVVWGAGVLHARGMLSRAWWRRFWQARGIAGKGLIGFAAVALLIAGLVGGGLVLRIANQPERAFATTRAIIWDAALAEIAAHPLVGSGLFTFGRELLRYQSTPPVTPHTHAHNLFLHVGAQFGILGLLVLGWFMWLVGRGWWRLWRGDGEFSRIEHLSVGCALVALTVHHQFDITAMMPSIAFIWLLLVAAAFAADNGTSTTTGSRPWPSVAIAGLVAGVLVSGWWSLGVQRAYYNALRTANNGEWAAGGQMLQAVVASDPSLALYPAEQGYVFAVAAKQGEERSLPEAIQAFRQAISVEDEYAPWHTNLGALLWEAGEREAALEAALGAVTRAPQDPNAWLQVGFYAESLGDAGLAREAYNHALEYSNAYWLLFWDATSLRQDVRSAFKQAMQGDEIALTIDEVVQQIAGGNTGRALQLLNAQADTQARSVWWRVLMAVAYARLGDWDRADLWFETVALYRVVPEDDVWLWAGRLVADTWRSGRSAETWQALLTEYRERYTQRGRAYPYGENLAWFHFYRPTFPEQFVPQAVTIPPAFGALYMAHELAGLNSGY